MADGKLPYIPSLSRLRTVIWSSPTTPGRIYGYEDGAGSANICIESYPLGIASISATDENVVMVVVIS